jgi:hypothetical protein
MYTSWCGTLVLQNNDIFIVYQDNKSSMNFVFQVCLIVPTVIKTITVSCMNIIYKTTFRNSSNTTARIVFLKKSERKNVQFKHIYYSKYTVRTFREVFTKTLKTNKNVQ